MNDSCARCHSTCETCSDGSPHACLSCPAKNLLQNNTCVVECSSGFFIDQSGCQPCLHTCEECLSRTNCSKCRTPLLLQSGECRTTCANGYVTTSFSNANYGTRNFSSRQHPKTKWARESCSFMFVLVFVPLVRTQNERNISVNVSFDGSSVMNGGEVIRY